MFIFLQAHISLFRFNQILYSEVRKFHLFLFILATLLSVNHAAAQSVQPLANDSNGSGTKLEVIRVIKPGIFDLQAQDYIIRMRVWGVSFPKRGQPGFDQAISYCEKMLLSTNPILEVVRTFDENNLKVVKVGMQGGKLDFSLDCISNGLGWHNEEETGRFGPLVLAQLKAKRANLGIWKTGFNYKSDPVSLQTPQPSLPGAYMRRNQLLPQISYWVTSFGKIHRPGCSFYERGRGTLMAKPDGTDCRICGGRKGKK